MLRGLWPQRYLLVSDQFGVFWNAFHGHQPVSQCPLVSPQQRQRCHQNQHDNRCHHKNSALRRARVSGSLLIRPTHLQRHLRARATAPQGDPCAPRLRHPALPSNLPTRTSAVPRRRHQLFFRSMLRESIVGATEQCRRSMSLLVATGKVMCWQEIVAAGSARPPHSPLHFGH